MRELVGDLREGPPVVVDVPRRVEEVGHLPVVGLSHPVGERSHEVARTLEVGALRPRVHLDGDDHVGHAFERSVVERHLLVLLALGEVALHGENLHRALLGREGELPLEVQPDPSAVLPHHVVVRVLRATPHAARDEREDIGRKGEGAEVILVVELGGGDGVRDERDHDGEERLTVGDPLADHVLVGLEGADVRADGETDHEVLLLLLGKWNESARDAPWKKPRTCHKYSWKTRDFLRSHSSIMTIYYSKK